MGFCWFSHVASGLCAVELTQASQILARCPETKWLTRIRYSCFPQLTPLKGNGRIWQKTRQATFTGLLGESQRGSRGSPGTEREADSHIYEEREEPSWVPHGYPTKGHSEQLGTAAYSEAFPGNLPGSMTEGVETPMPCTVTWPTAEGSTHRCLIFLNGNRCPTPKSAASGVTGYAGAEPSARPGDCG